MSARMRRRREADGRFALAIPGRWIVGWCPSFLHGAAAVGDEAARDRLGLRFAGSALGERPLEVMLRQAALPLARPAVPRYLWHYGAPGHCDPTATALHRTRKRNAGGTRLPHPAKPAWESSPRGGARPEGCGGDKRRGRGSVCVQNGCWGRWPVGEGSFAHPTRRQRALNAGAFDTIARRLAEASQEHAASQRHHAVALCRPLPVSPAAHCSDAGARRCPLSRLSAGNFPTAPPGLGAPASSATRGLP